MVSKAKVLVKSWFLVVFIILLICSPPARAEPNIRNVTHSPQNPVAGEDISVFVEVNNTSNITEVKLQYCTVDPGLCYPHITMTLDNKTYSAQITRDFEDGTIIEYNITITYDAGHKKAQKAVDIIKDILAGVDEVNKDTDHPPRVYFNDFNDWSLNIYMTYWVKPPDWWVFHEVNQRVNLEMMKRFEAEGIEFAFPTQTLHLKKE